MSDDPEIDRLLAGLDGPATPSPRLEARVRDLARGVERPAAVAGLPGDRGSVDDLAPEGPSPLDAAPRARRSPLWVAAAVLVLVALGALVVSRSPERVSSDGPPLAAPGPVLDVDAVDAACGRFNAEAFSPRTRREVIGEDNARFITSEELALAHAALLERRLDVLGADLEAAGVGSDILRGVERAEGQAATVRRLAAYDDPLALLQARLRDVEEALLAVDATLVEQGMAPCR